MPLLNFVAGEKQRLSPEAKTFDLKFIFLSIEHSEASNFEFS